MSRTPLFQVYFNLLNFVDEIRLPGTNQTTPFIESWAQSEENFSKFDLTFYAGIHERKLKLAMVYNVDLFGEDFIARLAAALGSDAESVPWPELNEDEVSRLTFTSGKWKERKRFPGATRVVTFA